jgi:hypothetical protein
MTAAKRLALKIDMAKRLADDLDARNLGTIVICARDNKIIGGNALIIEALRYFIAAKSAATQAIATERVECP